MKLKNQFRNLIILTLLSFTFLPVQAAKPKLQNADTIMIGPHLRNGFSLYSEKRKVGMTYYLAHIENNQVSQVSSLSEKLYQNMKGTLQKMETVLSGHAAKKSHRFLATACETPVQFLGQGATNPKQEQSFCADDFDEASRLKFKDWVHLAADLSQ